MSVACKIADLHRRRAFALQIHREPFHQIDFADRALNFARKGLVVADVVFPIVFEIEVQLRRNVEDLVAQAAADR